MFRFRRRGFTDKCYIFYTKAWLSIIAIGLLLTVLSGFLGITDLSPVNTCIEKSTEVMMVFTGFIVWKAKTENINKHNKQENLDDDMLQ